MTVLFVFSYNNSNNNLKNAISDLKLQVNNLS